MAVTAPIPQPQMGYQALNDSMANSQSIFNSLTANKRTNALLPGEVQKQEDEHLLAPYTRDLTHSQAQSNYAQATRSNKLLPYDMQKDADEHAYQKYRIETAIADNNLKNAQTERSTKMLPGDLSLQPSTQAFTESEAAKNNELIRQSVLKRKIDLAQRGLDENGNPIPQADANMPATVGASSSPIAPSNDTSMFNQLVSPQGNGMDALSGNSPAMTPIGGTTGFQNTPIAGIPGMPNTPMNAPSSASLYPALAQKVQSMTTGNNQGAAPQTQSSQNQMPSTSQGQQQAPQLNNSSVENQNPIIETQHARKGEEWKDRATETDNMGDKISAVKTGYHDGYLFNYYPSGKITKQLAGPTKASEKEEELNITNADAQDKAAQNNFNGIGVLSEMYNILKEHPEVAGLVSGTAKDYYLNPNSAAGRYVALATQAQADLGRQGSQRGGAYALQFAKGGKADIKNPTTYNLGMLGGLIDEKSGDIENARALKKHYSSKDLIFNYPSSYNKAMEYRNAEKKAAENKAKNVDKKIANISNEDREYYKKTYHWNDSQLDQALRLKGYK